MWPTLTTGCWPSRHGFYSDLQLANGTYEARRCDPRSSDPRGCGTPCRTPAVGARFSTSRSRHPHSSANVVQLVEWGAHDRFVPLGSTPDTLVADVIREFGEYPVQPKCDDYTRTGDLAGLLDALQRGITAKERLTSSFLEHEPWELLWVVFSEGHCTGHQFWAVHDPTHPSHDLALREELGGVPLLSVYEQLDAAFGRLLLKIPASTTVVALLSHGMRAHYDGEHLMSEILHRLDVADDGRRRFITWRERRRRRLSRRGRDARRAKPLASEHRFFKVPNNGNYAGIRVNLIGREPRGRVARGAEYDAVVAGLCTDLLALEHPETGAPLVHVVVRADDHYDGPLRDWLPDLIVDWNRDAPITDARSAKVERSGA